MKLSLLSRPWRLGAWILSTLVLAILATQVASGGQPFGPDGSVADFLVALLHAALLAYSVAAYLAIVQRSERTYAELRQHVRDASLLRLACCLPPSGPAPRGWRLALLVGAGLAWLGPYLSETGTAGPWHWWWPGDWSPETAWHRILSLVAAMVLALFGYAVLHVSRQLRLVAAGLARVDLFRPEELRPFADQALTNGLMVAGAITLLGLFGFDQGLTPMLALTCGALMLLVLVALALPLLGVRKRILEEKQRQLAHCEQVIAEARTVFQADAPASSGRLADAIALRQLLLDVREWTFDTPGLRRAVSLFLIPLVSWLASALAQPWLERLLGK